MRSLNVKRSAKALICFAALGSAGVATAKDLNVATFGGAWTEAAKAAYWDPFTSETGTKIIGDITDDSLGAIRAVASTPKGKWDVVELEMMIANEACSEGLLLPIDKSRLPQSDYIPSSIHECAIASAAVGTVLVINTTRFPTHEPTTWQDFWDIKKFPGTRGLSRYVQSVAVAALLADGVRPEDVNAELRKPDAQKRVFAKLDEIKDRVVFFSTGAEFAQGLVSGSYDMALGWNARINSANDETGGIFKILWSAGYNLGMNAFVIPANTNDQASAMDYIASTASPERQAKFMEMFPYGGANKKAYELLTPEQRDLQPANPANLRYAVNDDYDFWAGRLDQWQQALESWIASK
ncbi:extracellular solute-binding protein [Mesorhizobium wenxiniae]|nr:extracellular solute-binding protein [Mesorhizobium wenxiniae]